MTVLENGQVDSSPPGQHRRSAIELQQQQWQPSTALEQHDTIGAGVLTGRLKRPFGLWSFSFRSSRCGVNIYVSSTVEFDEAAFSQLLVP